MEKSFFFNAVVTGGVPDRSYSAEDLALRESCLISDGVIGGESLHVASGAGTGVYLSSGTAIISGYTYINTSILYLPIGTPNSKYDRIDTVAVKLDLSARRMEAVVMQGTAGKNPVANTLAGSDTVKYLPIADILVRGGSVLAVEEEDITDRRILAGYASSKEDLMLLLREYIGEIAPVTAGEMTNIRQSASVVRTNAGANTVLCGDGEYRQNPAALRVVAAVYTDPGDYVFDTAVCPSVGEVYDIEVQGAGGGGGSYNGAGSRGGGGGGGAFITASKVSFPRGTAKIRVGLGGVGVPGGSGSDGGFSAVDGFVANGGKGGLGGALATGGKGGAGLYSGGAGADGDSADNGTLYTTCGMGGSSYYGDGAPSKSGIGSVSGIDAEYPGAGGSGGTAESGTFSEAGGSGGNGMVTVYRYAYPGEV